MAEPIVSHHATDPPLLILWQDYSAAITTEYAILAALLAIMAVASAFAFGDGVSNLWSAVGRDVGDALAVP